MSFLDMVSTVSDTMDTALPFIRKFPLLLQWPENLTSSKMIPFVHIRCYDAVNKEAKEKANIFLPLPNIAIKYNGKWQPFDNKLQQVGSIVKEYKNVLEGNFAGAADYAPGSLEKLLGKLGDNSWNNSFQNLAKRATNPLQSFAYKGPDFREFSLDFNFAARNAEESEEIYNIITTLKYLMHPAVEGAETESGSKFWVYPEDWQVDLYNGIGDAGEYLFKFKRSLCTELRVSYGANGLNAFFRNTGAPVSCQVSMQFTEKTLLSKEDIAQGF